MKDAVVIGMKKFSNELDALRLRVTACEDRETFFAEGMDALHEQVSLLEAEKQERTLAIEGIESKMSGMEKEFEHSMDEFKTQI